MMEPFDNDMVVAAGSTGSTPTDAHQALTTLLTRTLLEVARRRQDELPGLAEAVEDDVVVLTGVTMRRGMNGWFLPDAWWLGDRRAHELFVNADQLPHHAWVSPTENLLTTLAHELAHVWAQINEIRDTSRDGRYHNRRFAEIALAIGLHVERDRRIGHRTPHLSAKGRFEYADLLTSLEQGMTLVREPEGPPNSSADGGEQAKQSEAAVKYVFASCRCQAARGPVTIRVAVGSWRPDVIRCDRCGTPFVVTKG